jgi:hypothetical protein
MGQCSQQLDTLKQLDDRNWPRRHNGDAGRILHSERHMVTRYEIALGRLRATYHCLHTYELEPRFIPAYNSGEQLHVLVDGKIAKGQVDMVFGPKPVFILAKPGVRGHFWSLDSSAEILT